jgi:hypothetical protein
MGALQFLNPKMAKPCMGQLVVPLRRGATEVCMQGGIHPSFRV